jgi:hypothetical protein
MMRLLGAEMAGAGDAGANLKCEPQDFKAALFLVL